jgi:hypothetical protein
VLDFGLDFQQIAVSDYQIRPLTLFDRPDFVRLSPDFCGINGDRLQSFIGGQSECRSGSGLVRNITNEFVSKGSEREFDARLLEFIR